MNTPRPELAGIFRMHGDAYQAAHPLSRAQARAMKAISECRTEALGGHLQQCDSCGHQRALFNSCCNRNCPKCQDLARARWLAERKAELLPIEYFHVVFTVPAPIADLAFYNQPGVYDILFHAVRDTLVRIAADPRHLGAQIGVLAILHTWGQNLLHHPHVHCVVPNGGLSHDGSRWVPPHHPGFLFPVRVLSRLFRRIFIERLQRAHQQGSLWFAGTLAHLGDHVHFERWTRDLSRQDWVIYAKAPFAGADQVLEYLARYTHRTAIANSRIVEVTQDHVRFKWRDYRRGYHQEIMTLHPQEFIRRFLQHVLPKGMVRIRYFGFLANRHRAEKLERCRALLPSALDQPTRLLPGNSRQDWKQLYTLLAGRDPDICTACNQGRMHLLLVIPRPDPYAAPPRPPRMDSS